MRVIAKKTLVNYWLREPRVEQSLKAWYDEIAAARWKSPNELKSSIRSASILSGKRVVFNIHGNAYRLIVDIEYGLEIVFIVWVGSHAEYDRIDAKRIEYAKTNKD